VRTVIAAILGALLSASMYGLFLTQAKGLIVLGAVTCVFCVAVLVVLAVVEADP
jgi:hypothetical protein